MVLSKRSIPLALATAVHLWLSAHPAVAHPLPEPKPVKGQAKTPKEPPKEYPFKVKKTGLVLEMGKNGQFEFTVEPTENVEAMNELNIPNNPFPSVDGKIQTVNAITVTPLSARVPLGKGFDGVFKVETLRSGQYVPNSPTRAETPFSIHTVLGGGAYRPDFNKPGVTVMSAGVGGKDVRIRAIRAQGQESYYQMGLHVGREEGEEHEGGKEDRPEPFSVQQIYAALRRYDPEKEAPEAEPHREPMEGEGIEPRIEAPAMSAQRRNTIILGVEAGNEDARIQLEGHIGAKPGVYLKIGMPFWTGTHPHKEMHEPEVPKARGRKQNAPKRPEVVRRAMRR